MAMSIDDFEFRINPDIEAQTTTVESAIDNFLATEAVLQRGLNDLLWVKVPYNDFVSEVILRRLRIKYLEAGWSGIEFNETKKHFVLTHTAGGL